MWVCVTNEPHLRSSLRVLICLTSPQVFIRELISNGSDALEKLRHRLITAGGESAPMEVHLQTDGAKGTFTIQVHFIPDWLPWFALAVFLSPSNTKEAVLVLGDSVLG